MGKIVIRNKGRDKRWERKNGEKFGANKWVGGDGSDTTAIFLDLIGDT